MKPQTSLMACLGALSFLFLGLATIGLAQNAPGDDAASTPAIAYSEMQTPVPAPAGQAAPDPIPPTQQQQPEDRPAPGRPGQGEREPEAASAQPDAARTMTGTIIKNGDQYVLTTKGNINFQLDDQERASHYRDKQVKVTGTVDATTRKIHVQNIEPLV